MSNLIAKKKKQFGCDFIPVDPKDLFPHHPRTNRFCSTIFSSDQQFFALSVWKSNCLTLLPSTVNNLSDVSFRYHLPVSEGFLNRVKYSFNRNLLQRDRNLLQRECRCWDETVYPISTAEFSSVGGAVEC